MPLKAAKTGGETALKMEEGSAWIFFLGLVVEEKLCGFRAVTMTNKEATKNVLATLSNISPLIDLCISTAKNQCF